MREEVWYFDRAVAALSNRLEAMVEDGVLAEMELSGELKKGEVL